MSSCITTYSCPVDTRARMEDHALPREKQLLLINRIIDLIEESLSEQDARISVEFNENNSTPEDEKILSNLSDTENLYKAKLNILEQAHAQLKNEYEYLLQILSE